MSFEERIMKNLANNKEKYERIGKENEASLKRFHEKGLQEAYDRDNAALNALVRSKSKAETKREEAVTSHF